MCLFVFCGVLVTIQQHEALAETNADLAQRWGLIGIWMSDCSQPATGLKPKKSFIVRDGKLFHDRDGGNWQDSSEITRITLKPNGSIEILITFQAFKPPQTSLFELIKGPDGRTRAWSNFDVNNARYTIKDGKMTASGEQSPWQTRC
jgi:hypothetical protein